MSRSVSPTESAVITLGKIDGGVAPNVLANLPALAPCDSTPMTICVMPLPIASDAFMYVP